MTKIQNTISISNIKFNNKATTMDFIDKIKSSNSGTVRFQDCTFDNESLRLLMKTVLDNPTITELRLTCNGIGNVGAKIIAEELSTNHSLIVLDLGTNNIGNPGATDLASAIKENATLEYLRLNDNRIGTEGGKAILEALQENSALKTVHLVAQVNDFDADVLRKINQALTKESIAERKNIVKSFRR